MPEHSYLQDVLVLLAALLVSVPLFERLGIGSVLAYLVAGVAIGPSVLGLVGAVEETRGIGEFGVVFLLFAVGLELKYARLRLFGPKVFALSIAQVLATTLLMALLALALGVNKTGAFLIGATLALSSTAVVLQLLGERAHMAGATGRVALAILLVQDASVGPLLVFVSVAGTGNSGLSSALGIALANSAIVITVIIVAERTILRPLLRLAASAASPEVFTGATLLLVLGVGWATQQAGLSMALGAFLAGMMVADTEFRHQVAADIQPFRGLFLGLFFMNVGMTLDVGLAFDQAGAVGALVVTIMSCKAAVIIALSMGFGIRRDRALGLGLLLSQGSEFAFVLLGLAAANQLVPEDAAQLLIVAIGISMAVTAAGSVAVRRLARSRLSRGRSTLGKLEEEGEELNRHVVVAGFGQVGKAVARHLAGQRIPIVVLDLHPQQVTASRARGLPVFYGNAARLDLLRAAHLERAEALVVAVPDPDTAEQITAVARQAYPALRIFTRVPDPDWVRRVRKAGANAVAIDGLTTALELAERVVMVYEPLEPASE